MRTLIFLIIVGLALNSSFALAKDGEDQKSTKSNLRCEKFRDRNLSTLKEKMEEFCNLEKPFSTGLASNLGEETYLYCCITK